MSVFHFAPSCISFYHESMNRNNVKVKKNYAYIQNSLIVCLKFITSWSTWNIKNKLYRSGIGRIDDIFYNDKDKYGIFLVITS